MSDASIHTDVLIIGGGFTGLSAARELDRLGVDFLLVDSFGDHAGGRAYSYASPEEAPDGDAVALGGELRFDHGAQYVGDLQNRIMEPIRELLDDDALVNGAELRLPYPWEVMVLNQRRMAFRADQSLLGIPGAPPQLGVLGALQMIALLAEMTLIEWCIDTVTPWEGPDDLLALDQVTLWDWVTGKDWVKPEVADLVRISCEALLSVEPAEISLYYFLWYCACNDGFLTEINDGTGGPQQYWLRQGTDALARRFADPIADRIERGVSANAIDTRGERVRIALSDGREADARRVLVATSPATAARRIAFTPELDEERRELLAQPMGRTLKCQVYYATDWWHRAAGGLAYDGYVGGAHYPILWVMDNSPPEAHDRGGPFVLMTFTVADMLDPLGSSPSQEAIEAYVTGALRDLFDDERALSTSGEFRKLVSYLWDPSEERVGGGPNTIFTPGKLTKVGHLLDEPIDDVVFFASAESSLNPDPQSPHSGYDPFASEHLPEYDDRRRLKGDSKPPFHSRYSDRRKGLGYMDGALGSGEYAARRIAGSLGLAVSLPSPPVHRPTMAPPAEPEAHPDSLLHAVTSGLADALEQLTPEALAAHADHQTKAGHRGRASWLRGQLAYLLAHHGHLAPDASPMEILTAIRDFAVSLARRLGDESVHLPELAGAVARADAAIAALLKS